MPHKIIATGLIMLMQVMLLVYVDLNKRTSFLSSFMITLACTYCLFALWLRW